MGTPTYQPIANGTIGTAVTSITFSAITQQYRDLVLVVNGSMSSDSALQLNLNGDYTASYNSIRTQGNGSSTSSDTVTNNGNMAIQQIYYTANAQLVYTFNFFDYSATDKHKTVLARNNSAANAASMEVHRWAMNSAITSITVKSGVGNFNTGSTFALYGILA